MNPFQYASRDRRGELTPQLGMHAGVPRYGQGARRIGDFVKSLKLVPHIHISACTDGGMRGADGRKPHNNWCN